MKEHFNPLARLKGVINLRSGHVIDGEGNHAWYFRMKLHRDGAPAWISKAGTRKWYRYGRLWRDDGPAIEWADGDREWYFHGKLGRWDGPAVEKTDGFKAWYIGGILHREDGPAVIHPDGRMEWFKEGKAWPEGALLTKKITDEQKMQQVEEAVKGATVVDADIKVRKPISIKRPPAP